MDCYSSVESEFIESLDFLSPPVKRIHGSKEVFGSTYRTESNDVHLLRGLRSKFARRPSSSTKASKPTYVNGESSTSLILKKTSERKILQHYSIVSYTSLQNPGSDIHSQLKSDKNQHTEKPLIKVTVIPKSDQIQTAKILRKRRYIPKIVQSTTSNHENSIQTKNVYLIVAGRRREKIYEIKTTGSANFSKDPDSFTKHDEVPTKELSNFKHLIQSLTMDKKKKKDKKAAARNSEAPQQTSSEWKDSPQSEFCCCEDNSKNNTSKKSRVKIFGQFGISEDDKYVLRYGATINDKQVLSDVAQLTQDFTRFVVPETSNGTTGDEYLARQRDSSVQADYEDKFEIEQLPVKDKVPSKESQGTQVNFNIQVASTRMRSSKLSDKKIQCSCYTVANQFGQKPLKDCQSPLVIISVYPKQSPEDITAPNRAENVQCPSPLKLNTYTSNQIIKIDKGTRRSHIERKRVNKTPPMSRSSSPIKSGSRSKLQEDKPIKTQVSEKKSPDRQKALRAIKYKILEKEKLKHDVGTRKLSKFNTSNATQVSKYFQNLTVSNATQVSKKNRQLVTASNATQVSASNRRNYNTDTATQYCKTPESIATSFATQDVGSLQSSAPIKHPKIISAIKDPQNMNDSDHPRTALVSHATQIYGNIPNVMANVGVQVVLDEKLTASNGTQVSKDHKLSSNLSKNKETLTKFKATPVINNEHTFKPLSQLVNEKGTNTDHARAKKALVETYTKKLTEQMNQKDTIPTKFVNSKVAINIDGDNEYYDVLFNRDKLSTDLTIRKTLKDVGSQKVKSVDEYSASLENLYIPDCAEGERWLSPGSKSPTSIALYNNRSDAVSPLAKHGSRFTIRDSLEISHRREDKSNHNMKNTQTCFTAQFSNKFPDETEFLAPIKHYTGDDCSICDPIARDKQIRELLGVAKTKNTYPKQARNCENDDQFPYQCIYRQQCKKKETTEFNYQFQKLRTCFKSNHNKDVSGQYAYRHRSVQCRYSGCPETNFNNNYSFHGSCFNNDDSKTYEIDSGCCLHPLNYVSKKTFCRDKNSCFGRYHNYNIFNNDGVNQSNDNDDNEQDDTRYASEEKSTIYQQLILNRNIQVFLQVDQFSKQKPIILSRKQYNKVKKTIQKTISKKRSYHDRRKRYVCNKGDSSKVSVGEVRTKTTKDPKSLHEREAQTELVPCSRENGRKRRRDKKSKSRKTESIAKYDSSHQSGDLTDCRRSLNRKKERFSDHKTKLKADQNKEHFHIDYSGPASLSSDENNKNGERNEKLKAERAVRPSGIEQKQSRDLERQTEQKTSRSPERLTEQKRNISPERYSEQKRSRSPDRHSKQKESRGIERHSEQKDRCAERHCQNACRSPARHSEEIHTRCTENNCQENECRCPKTKSEQNEEQRRYNDMDQSNNDTAIEKNEKELRTVVLFNADNIKRNSKDVKDTDNEAHTRKTMSSVEIRYASIAFMKEVAYSSTDIGALSDSSLAHVNSFRTIFRGHRKSPTPNLGTSAYSLYTEDVLNSDNKSAKFIMQQRDSKPKKPFLRRLMSCLVMRSTRDSELKLPTGPTPDLPSVNSSIDSYHISTSLGAVEVSSSIYDTSASFFSNHTILPVNSKIKRGFFSSVRGFLTNRKS